MNNSTFVKIGKSLSFVWARRKKDRRRSFPGKPIVKISLLNYKKLAAGLSEERGSAVIEFVVLTLPLFVPFALYLGVINAQSQVAFDAHNLARQVARAFITSPSEAFTEARVKTVLNAFSAQILKRHGINSTPEVSIVCSANSCLTPGASVRVTISIEDTTLKPAGYLRFLNTSPTRVVASDTQVVDAWRSTP